MKKILFIICLVFLTVGSVHADTLTLSGPALSSNISGYANCGLQITAVQDVTLEQFDFNNQTRPDVIRLEDSNGNVVGSYSYAGGDSVHTVKVQWKLAAGTTYRLVAASSTNGKYAPHDHIAYPAANDHIKVDGTSTPGGLWTAYWFHFTSLQTSTEVAAGTLPVEIDIKPGSSPNVINLNSHARVRVAILSGDGFDATTVDPATVEMAGAKVLYKNKKKGKKFKAKKKDVNEDGKADLVVKFATKDLDPKQMADGKATLIGSTSGARSRNVSVESAEGINIEGSDDIRVIKGDKRRRKR